MILLRFLGDGLVCGFWCFVWHHYWHSKSSTPTVKVSEQAYAACGDAGHPLVCNCYSSPQVRESATRMVHRHRKSLEALSDHSKFKCCGA